MVLQYTDAYSSRITKRNPAQRRASSSPFASLKRGKPGSLSRQSSQQKEFKKKEKDPEDEDLFEERLDDLGLVAALAADQSLRDVAQYLTYIHNHMFESIPERSGMNSTRISELLNYRQNLPPLVTVAHVHALSKSPTTTEREIAELIRRGVIRKVVIPGRGAGSTAVGDMLVLVSTWNQMIRDSPLIDEAAKVKYIELMAKHPFSQNIPSTSFEPTEVAALIKAGFLTSASHFNTTTMMRPDVGNTGTLASLSTVGSRAAAGSTAAIGGENAILDAGGGGSTNLSKSAATTKPAGGELAFSLPSIGAYLRLVGAARAHLVQLLSRAKYKEAPLDLLRERWDGGVATSSSIKSGRDVGAVLPGRTKKWKTYNGLRFQWILEECLGTGVVEIFNTGSVGFGVRLTSR